MKKITSILLAALLFASCNTTNEASKFDLKFKDRTVNIAPYFQDFPYISYLFTISDDAQNLFYMKTGEENSLMWLNLNESTDLSKGTRLVDLDFAKRNYWRSGYNDQDSCLYWMGDEKNEEIINLYRTKLGTNQVEKLTDIHYIYGWNFNADKSKIYYIVRLGKDEKSPNDFRVIDLKNGKDEVLYADKSDYRLTWGQAGVKPDEKGAVMIMLKDANRTYTNLVYIDFATKEQTLLTNPNIPGSYSGTGALNEWLSNDICIFTTDQTGYKNLYKFDLPTKKVSQLTSFEKGIDDARIVTVGDKKYIFAVQSNPISSKLMLIDPQDGKVLKEQESTLDLRIAGGEKNNVTLFASATDVVFQIVGVSVSENGFEQKLILDLPKEQKDKLISSTVERLSIPTFDVDPATGETRMIHAYLYVPKNPLPKGQEVVMVQSFYGGDNSYDQEAQIYCQAGMYVLSPSPRGSSGFGREFAALNDKDLGGSEIVDIINCAKYVSEKLGIPAERIGCFGMSHGGYATMRLMTFPGEANGVKASFPFGFGVEVAGFADIIYQHNHSNIPGWTFLEAGDPSVEADSLRLVDRSPINHADKITGPLLLIHGNHDNRVDVEGSRVMANKLKEIGKPYEYLELEGQGHGVKGIENNITYYATIFKFLETYK